MSSFSASSSVGKLQSLQHVLHVVLAIADDDDTILLVKQENIQSVEELTLLVLSTDWGRGVVITMGETRRPIRDVPRSRLVQLTRFSKYLQQENGNDHPI